MQDIGDSESCVMLGPDISGVENIGCTTRLITKIVGLYIWMSLIGFVNFKSIIPLTLSCVIICISNILCVFRFGLVNNYNSRRAQHHFLTCYFPVQCARMPFSVLMQLQSVQSPVMRGLRMKMCLKLNTVFSDHQPCHVVEWRVNLRFEDHLSPVACF